MPTRQDSKGSRMRLQISQNELPVEEWSAAESIGDNLSSLESLARDFRENVSFYLFLRACEKQFRTETDMYWRENSAWFSIAARSGAILAQSFGAILQAISSTRCPILWSKVDTSIRKLGTRLYAEEFPTIRGIRDSAAHPEEFAKSREQFNQNRMGNETSSLYISNSMQTLEDSMIVYSTVKGRIVSYELSMRKADKLDQVIWLFEHTFSVLENQDDAKRRAMVAANDRQRHTDETMRQPWWHALVEIEGSPPTKNDILNNM